MCVKCHGGTRTKTVYVHGRPTKIEYEVAGDGNVQRHTVTGLRPAPRPDPVEHGTLRGIRWHRGLRTDNPRKYGCQLCDEYETTDDYTREMRLDALANVSRRLDALVRLRSDPDEDVDLELLEFYEKKRALLERLLRGDNEKPVKKREKTEPLELLHIRVRESQAQELRERAEEEETSVSELVRQSIDAFLVL